MEEFRSYSVLNFVRSEKQSVDLCRFIFCATITISTDRVLKFFARYAREMFSNSTTGLFLVYSRHVLHLIESTEDEIFRICSYFVNAEPKFLGISKCFPMQIKIDERYFHEWHARKIIDNCNTMEINDEKFLENFDNMKNIYSSVVDNLYNFCEELRASRTVNRTCFNDKLDGVGTNGDPRLPEVKILEKILKSSWGDSLEKIVEDYHRGISSMEIEEVIWPFPASHCPPIDTIK